MVANPAKLRLELEREHSCVTPKCEFRLYGHMTATHMSTHIP